MPYEFEVNTFDEALTSECERKTEQHLREMSEKGWELFSVFPLSMAQDVAGNPGVQSAKIRYIFRKKLDL